MQTPLSRKAFFTMSLIVGTLWMCLVFRNISLSPVFPLIWQQPTITSYIKLSTKRPIRYPVPLSKISKYLQKAVVLAEDDTFFKHGGVDFKAIKKAIKTDWKRKKFAFGASTITMQLARNLYLTPLKSPIRKLKEIMLALKLERCLSKKRILELYLNCVEWGNGIYGAEAAAEHYFHKHATSIDRHEAAYLATILPKPKFYDGRKPTSYLEKRIEAIEKRL